MTDLATKPGAESASAEDATLEETAPITDADDIDSGDPGSPTYAWAPAEPQPRKRRTGLWIGLAAGGAVVALVASSLVLIAPGTSIAGVSVGGLTPGAAAEAIQQRLADTVIVLTGDGGDAEVTGADLGASVDAAGLSEAAFAANPMWNLGAWFPASVDANVRLEADAANSALRAAAPDLYTDPVDATLAFDAAAATYVTTPAVDGAGVDIDAVREALQTAFAAGETRVELDATLAAVTPGTPTFVAESTAATLNSVLDDAGFYVGAERTVPIDRAVAASWLTVTPGERGTFDISADEAAIEEVVGTLAAAVDREKVDASVITDSDGAVLREITAGVNGRTLGDTSDVAGEFAAALAGGDGSYELPVTETEFATSAVARRIEVDLGAQRAYLFENGKVIQSYAVSSGLPGTPTFTGSYRMFAKVPMQDMGCFEGAPYCTENVPWVSYYNGDQALHGAYWHNNFGNQMSHGCVNLPVDIAKFVYDWAPIGTEVWVHA
ncbi:L,D-transpeptidase family protein [Microbacterium sp. 2FI]|uniref:L,D-transpeptidase family protein n=1 Tax=Microbacterium sp. 2FI TaxID=2502193 RepID=UPI0010F48C7D|nr:L,D-transpeptidase family protein [Microbacterium sp. 2FI]